MITPAPAQQMDVGQLALFLANHVGMNTWCQVVCAMDQEAGLAQRLLGLVPMEGAPCMHLHGHGDLKALLSDLADKEDQVIVVTGLNTVPKVQWTLLDRMRSRLPTTCAVALLMTAATADALGAQVDDFSSWVGANLFELDPEQDTIAPEAREVQLQTLRDLHGRTDEEVLRLAAEGTLPRDNDFGVWLTLLGRGDLLARS